jgi:phenylpropionate dioxygenase-like ring-hydroxylating dioxygenase large terminal subunit
VNDLTDLLRSRIPGKSLSQEFYVAPELFEEELSRVFHTNWLFAGHTCEIPEPGDYFLLPVGGRS